MRHTCRACLSVFESARARIATCPDCSRACRICGGPHSTLGLCRRHHQRWVRAGKPLLPEFIAAGEEAGTAIRPCVVCGKPHHAARGKKTCSEECEQSRQRKRNREAKRREWQRRRDVLLARQRQRYHSQAGQQYAQAAHRRRWQEILSDPERHAEVKAKSTAHYRRNAAEIQRRRREKLASLSPEEIEAYRVQAVEACRRWREKLLDDPGRSEHHRRMQRRYKAARQRQRLAEEFLAVLAASSATEHREAKRCEVCGEPVIGRNPTAKTCSAECQQVRRREIVRRSQAKKRSETKDPDDETNEA